MSSLDVSPSPASAFASSLPSASAARSSAGALPVAAELLPDASASSSVAEGPPPEGPSCVPVEGSTPSGACGFSAEEPVWLVVFELEEGFVPSAAPEPSSEGEAGESCAEGESGARPISKRATSSEKAVGEELLAGESETIDGGGCVLRALLAERPQGGRRQREPADQKRRAPGAQQLRRLAFPYHGQLLTLVPPAQAPGSPIPIPNPCASRRRAGFRSQGVAVPFANRYLIRETILQYPRKRQGVRYFSAASPVRALLESSPITSR